MTWTTEARLIAPLSQVMDGTIGMKPVPTLLIVSEIDKATDMTGRLTCLYVAETTHGATSRLTWHIQRQTALGKYLLGRTEDWGFSFLVELHLIRWRLDEATQATRAALKPKYHRGDRPHKIGDAILRTQDSRFAHGQVWEDVQAAEENLDQSKRLLPVQEAMRRAVASSNTRRQTR